MIFAHLPFRRSILALAISLVCAPNAATSAVINVGGSCTLINAINNANADADTDGPKGCPAGSRADTINLAHHQSYLLTEVNNNTNGPNGLPSVTSIITINGNGSSVSRSDAQGTPDFRIFHVPQNGALTLKSMTIKNGSLPINSEWVCPYYCHPNVEIYNGAGIFNRGKTSLINTTITGNKNFGGDGGGIYNSGTLTLTDSVVSNNSTSGFSFEEFEYTFYNEGKGGGLLNRGKAVLTASTLSGNSTMDGKGGGIYNSGEMVLTASTLSGNSAKYTNYYDGIGGGIFNKGKAVLTASTLTGNSASSDGGGIRNEVSGTITAKDSIIANSGNGDCFNKSEFRSNGVNLIEDGNCDAKLSGDPKLGPLKYNGGPTRTHALLKDSPALDVRSCLPASTDQRGIIRPRPAGGRCDIGAYERIPVAEDSVSPSVWPLVDFFKTQVAGGGLAGTGSQTYPNRLAALNQLVAAGDYRDRALNVKACEQLDQLLRHIDPDASPDNNDYVTGSAAGALAERIAQLKSAWDCP